MDPKLLIGLLLVAIFSVLWAVMYAHRAYVNTLKILEKLGK